MLLENKRVLVTGGTGSLGKVLVRRILSGEIGTPSKLIVMSRDEGKQHHMRLDYMNRGASTDEVIYHNFENLLEFRIGDVRSYADVCSALKGVDVVFNAAALKQVPTCEYFPEQAVQTNCLGPANIVRAIREHDMPIDTVIGVSTDKACKPVNAMGMTKAIQERIFIGANILNRRTRFCLVRYGNVLASRGSVIPLFHEQIRAGGPVTLTEPNMTRFLLSIDDAVDTVFAALADARAGDIFIPIVPSATVENIARALIGERDIALKEIGVRPGEKMHEILISEEERHHVARAGGYHVIRPMLPELWDEDEAFKTLDAEYSSGDDVCDAQETHALLERNELLLEQGDLGHKEELLR
jgi:FlaA1/EpsC-like NDP-sugar epimerase